MKDEMQVDRMKIRFEMPGGIKGMGFILVEDEVLEH